MYDESLIYAINEAVSLTESRLTDAMPHCAQSISAWIRKLSGSLKPADYFLHPSAYPMFLFPWWAEKIVSTCHSPEFQKSIAYATANGYYYIRLIDDIMDADGSEDCKILPALNFFHMEFQSTYFDFFAADHRFWGDFRTYWSRSGDCAMHDSTLDELSEEQFCEVAAQKVCAVSIPVTAVCYYYNRADVIPPMKRLIELFGYWHQMLNDMFDWHKDFTHGNASFFLTRGRHSLEGDESVAMWFVRDGFSWGCGLLDRWMSDMKTVAEDLQNPDILDYLEKRDMMYCKKKDEMSKGINILRRLIDTAK